MCAFAALTAAMALTGCGGTTYTDNRTLPPSGITNRVLIAIQNPSTLSKGALEIVDAYYDIRSSYNGATASFWISGYGAALPSSIQNMPDEQLGAVYGSGDGSLTLINYQTEKTSGSISGLNGLSTSIFVTSNDKYVFAASNASEVLTVVDQTSGSSYPLSLPGVYRVSVNPSGTVAMAFVQNSNYVYYARQLTTAETATYSNGSTSWPKAAVDCEPQTAPGWCLFQAQSSDATDSTGNYYGAPLAFDHPVKALFSSDGSTAYVLSCGAECGGSAASVSLLPTAPMIFSKGLWSGVMPCSSTATSCTKTSASPMTSISVVGASNALISGTTMYVVGQQKLSDGYWGGYLTRLNLSTNAVVATTTASPNPVSISDGTPGLSSRMVLADDNTLWIGMQGCDSGERAYKNESYGCLTMYNTSSNTVTMLESYEGNATGIAAVTGLHKIYTAEGGQVYIYSTTSGDAIDNQYVTVTGTAYDVAYMDATTDTDNTVY
ncbi:hypothetical protein ACOBR2_05665 [Telmatobacter bradus]|uniref:hypothetical protein n=1 Tax=Telmatobacter bradus TaxID=474953 RepID=UPI003B430138